MQPVDQCCSYRNYDGVNAKAASAVTERLCSAANQICTNDRGGMKVKTMEKMVAASERIKDKIVPAGDATQPQHVKQAAVGTELA